eukprot:TRINITY_DN89278_c0_g1_i1.p1 TRINITY_DN89278_c0_g1~~TRINITY_DN89278_c0_g1_i1.p1  ORF type:complete len:452 (-),score=68.13 TRINITY_DN89278_c0_g1_i1:288-1643(-)
MNQAAQTAPTATFNAMKRKHQSMTHSVSQARLGDILGYPFAALAASDVAPFHVITGNLNCGQERLPQQPLPVVSLSKLMMQERSAVHCATSALRQRGFCWLEIAMSDALGPAAASALPMLSRFLSSEGRGTGRAHAMQGHFSTAHKDGIRMVTGDYSQEPNYIPEELKQMMAQLASAFDGAQLAVASALSPGFMGVSDPAGEKLGQVCSVPLLFRAHGMPSYGLMDAVMYRMGPDAPQEIVQEHTDPGLFVISLPSSPGLQLKDESGEWHSPPAGYGVLWAGTAGTKIGLRPGSHRVLRSPDGAPRLSVWHELCTSSQLCVPMLGLLERSNLELRLGNIRGTDAVLRALEAAEDHKLNAASQDQSHSHVPTLREAQLVELKGVPVGKSGVRIEEKFVPWKANLMGFKFDEMMPHGRKMRQASPRQPLPRGTVEIVTKESPDLAWTSFDAEP